MFSTAWTSHQQSFNPDVGARTRACAYAVYTMLAKHGDDLRRMHLMPLLAKTAFLLSLSSICV